MDNGLDLVLIPAPDEGVPADLEQQQSRMRRLPVDDARPLVRVSRRGMGGYAGGGININAGAGGLNLPDLHSILSFAGKVAPQLGTALVAYLHGRSGRKVKLKVGDIEVEASTAKEVEALLEKAQRSKRDNEPKRIHER